MDPQRSDHTGGKLRADSNANATQTQPARGYLDRHGELIATTQATFDGVIDPGRVNLFERWESQVAVKTFRQRAPCNKQGAATLSVSVAEYDIADARPLFGEGRA